jgi:hypothetical protein
MELIFCGKHLIKSKFSSAKAIIKAIPIIGHASFSPFNRSYSETNKINTAEAEKCPKQATKNIFSLGKVIN